MSDPKNDAIKPFCPVHHWRMACDPGSPKSGLSYRCNFDGCEVRYTPSQGYFESDKTIGDQAFLSRVEAVYCIHDRNHQPAIVGYTKDSNTQQTEEWRQWQCPEPGCKFSLRQRLSTADTLAAGFDHRTILQHHYAALSR
jgi:hypothetical protein